MSHISGIHLLRVPGEDNVPVLNLHSYEIWHLGFPVWGLSFENKGVRVLQFHIETLIIFKLNSRKFTSQNDLYQ